MRGGIWKRVFDQLASKSRYSLYLIDSAIVKAHRAASSAKGEKNKAIGISRGGQTTKIHAIVDSKGRPLSFMVTGGQVHDSQVVEEILNTPRPPLAVTADKACDSEKVRQQIRDEGALAADRHALRQARSQLPRRYHARRGTLLDQIVSPDPRRDLILDRYCRSAWARRKFKAILVI